MPPVSVIMPLYNASEFVEEAVNSIVCQTLSNFELHIMDDGSSDGTAEIVKGLGRQDNRIHFHARERRGISASLNELISLAKGRYIARMDGDDLAHPERLERQVKCMDANSTIGVCGSWVQTFGAKSEVWHFRRWDNFSRNLLFFGVTVLCHPSWMVRRELYERYKYDPTFDFIEDREWLARVAASEPDAAFVALPDILLDHRVHDASVTGQQASLQQSKTRDIVAALLSAYSAHLDQAELDLYMKACFTETAAPEELLRIGALLEKVHGITALRIRDDFKVFRQYWLKLCRHNNAGREMADAFVRSEDFCFIEEKDWHLQTEEKAK